MNAAAGPVSYQLDFDNPSQRSSVNPGTVNMNRNNGSARGTLRGGKAGICLAGLAACCALAGQPINFSPPKGDLDTPAKAREAEVLDERRQMLERSSGFNSPSRDIGRAMAPPPQAAENPARAKEPSHWLLEDRQTQLDRLSGGLGRAKPEFSPWSRSDETVRRVFGISSDEFGRSPRGGALPSALIGSRATDPKGATDPGGARRAVRDGLSEDPFGYLDALSHQEARPMPRRTLGGQSLSGGMNSVRDTLSGASDPGRYPALSRQSSASASSQVRSLFEPDPASSRAASASPGQPVAVIPGGELPGATRSLPGDSPSVFRPDLAARPFHVPTPEDYNKPLGVITPNTVPPPPKTDEQLQSQRMKEFRVFQKFSRPNL